MRANNSACAVLVTPSLPRCVDTRVYRIIQKTRRRRAQGLLNASAAPVDPVAQAAAAAAYGIKQLGKRGVGASGDMLPKS